MTRDHTARSSARSDTLVGSCARSTEANGQAGELHIPNHAVPEFRHCDTLSCVGRACALSPNPNNPPRPLSPSRGEAACPIQNRDSRIPHRAGFVRDLSSPQPSPSLTLRAMILVCYALRMLLFGWLRSSTFRPSRCPTPRVPLGPLTSVFRHREDPAPSLGSLVGFVKLHRPSSALRPASAAPVLRRVAHTHTRSRLENSVMASAPYSDWSYVRRHFRGRKNARWKSLPDHDLCLTLSFSAAHDP
jgi:hypothetical protein